MSDAPTDIFPPIRINDRNWLSFKILLFFLLFNGNEVGVDQTGVMGSTANGKKEKRSVNFLLSSFVNDNGYSLGHICLACQQHKVLLSAYQLLQAVSVGFADHFLASSIYFGLI